MTEEKPPEMVVPPGDDASERQPMKGITVITTHVNADFDAFASMLAAQKLYPDAVAVFPGSQEANLRNFFIQSMVYLFNLVSMKDIDLESIDRLVLVDTRQPSRIGRLAAILDRPDLEIHVYDHHPAAPGDIAGSFEACRLAGATITLLVEILKDKGIHITADEATVMCLGIYEDTGSFSFPSTTTEDFLAAAHLVSQGASLNVVSSLTVREITPRQIGLLNDMIQYAVRHAVHGIEVVVTTVSLEQYVPDFAFLVHKMMNMEDMEALFAVAAMGTRIYIVGRSRIPEVDVGAILSHFGGGGHSWAGAATVKDKTIPQVEDRLAALLHQNVKPRRTARDIMSAPPILTGAQTSIRDAERLLTQYNINALLVALDVAGKKGVLGVISRQVIEKALYHQLDELPVQEYMTSDPVTVSLEADLFEIQQKIMEHKQRILPVVRDEHIVGVITRTDLLNILVNQSQRMAETIGKQDVKHTRKVVKLLQDRLTSRLLGLLRTVGEVADAMGVNAYVVGGFVRDLFLFRKNEDMDVVIEGDGIAFAKRFAQVTGARTHSHAAFGTAVVIFPDGFKIDVASARFEYYRTPASLPIVETSSLKLDLYRRDFTINTMVIQLNIPSFGTLIDFFGAQRDLKAKAIRVLHNLSFVEDPTRVFRAIRFEQRFGFTIGKLTSGLIANAVRMDFFKRLSGRRVFSELRQILEEENPLMAIQRMHTFDLLQVIHPSIAFDNETMRLFQSVRQVLSWHDLLFLDEPYMKWAVNLLALIHACDLPTTEGIITRLELAPRHRALFTTGRAEAAGRLKALERNRPSRNSTLYRYLSPFQTELLLFMMAATKQTDVKRLISHYFTRLRSVSPVLSGKDLQKMGVQPGPIYREVIDAVRSARLDERVRTFDDEMALARRYLVQHGHQQDGP